MPDDVLARIEPTVNAIVTFAGMELVQMELRRESGGLVLRLYIDKDGGVGLEDCARISREVSLQLDAQDPISERYTLEVSSPGLDRPLWRDRDFERYAGHRARITTETPIDGQRNFIGRLAGLAGGSVRLLLEDGREIAIPRERIVRARLHDEPAAIGQKRALRGPHA